MLLCQDILSLHIIDHSELDCIWGREQADCGACQPPSSSVEHACRYHFTVGISVSSSSRHHELRAILVTQVAHALGAMVASSLGGEFATFS